MPLPPDALNDNPALLPAQIPPTGVALVTNIHESLVINFRIGRAPTLDLPSLWRLAKHVVYERGPLLVYRYKAITP